MKKFGAKRFTALIMALALVTIGGVYATWTFSENTTTGANQSFSITLAGSTVTSDKGTYSIEKISTIYIVDQYKSAISSLQSSTYSYVQTGGGTTVTPDYPSSGDTTTKVYYNYSYVSGTDTYYKRVYDETITYGTGGEPLERPRAVESDTTTAFSDVNNYTAALCTYADSYLRIKFTPSSDTQGTDVYDNGIITKFNFSWNNTASASPTITVDSNGCYDASGTNTIDIYNLDTSDYVIRTYDESGSAEKAWSLYDDTANTGDYYFYYDIKGEELVTYLTINKIILQSSSDYSAFASAASTAAFKLNVAEDSATPLTAVTLGASQNGNNADLTITDPNTAGTVGSYLVSIYDGTDPSSANVVAVLNIGSSTSYTLTAQTLSDIGLSSGTYYVRARAISADTTLYENSLLSDAVTIAWNGSAITVS